MQESLYQSLTESACFESPTDITISNRKACKKGTRITIIPWLP